MKIAPITDEQVVAHLNQPFNPPAESAGAKEWFGREWWSVLERVDEILSRFGKRDYAGYADYCLGTDWTFSRAVSVTVTSKLFLNAAVIDSLQQLLRELPNEYEIYFTHFMDDEPKWDVFLNSEECLVFGEAFGRTTSETSPKAT